MWLSNLNHENSKAPNVLCIQKIKVSRHKQKLNPLKKNEIKQPETDMRKTKVWESRNLPLIEHFEESEIAGNKKKMKKKKKESEGSLIFSLSGSS